MKTAIFDEVSTVSFKVTSGPGRLARISGVLKESGFVWKSFRATPSDPGTVIVGYDQGVIEGEVWGPKGSEELLGMVKKDIERWDSKQVAGATKRAAGVLEVRMSWTAGDRLGEVFDIASYGGRNIVKATCCVDFAWLPESSRYRRTELGLEINVPTLTDGEQLWSQLLQLKRRSSDFSVLPAEDNQPPRLMDLLHPGQWVDLRSLETFEFPPSEQMVSDVRLQVFEEAQRLSVPRQRESAPSAEHLAANAGIPLL